MVEVRNVSKRFQQGGDCIDALKNISLKVGNRELVMIVGPSGCGKTTLLSVIAGTLFFDRGEIDLFGNSLHRLSQKEITTFRRQHIGFIFQQFHLIPTLNCMENVMVPLLLNGVCKKEAEEKACFSLEQVGLNGREKENPKKLSGGQQQRVAIARALVHEPKLIICDEPTSSLDLDTGLRVMELLKEKGAKENKCLLLVTHDNRIFKYADRVIKMDDGQIVG